MFDSQTTSPDLLDHEHVVSDQDYIGWYPVEGNTRGQAVQRFTRSMRHAGWTLSFIDVRAVKRFLHSDPQRHPDEGRYLECNEGDPGATPVWRCELRGGSSWIQGGKLA